MAYYDGTSPMVRDSLRILLDFANEKCYPGTGSSVFDLSGNGYHGTIYGIVPYDKKEGAGSFSYTGNSSNYIFGTSGYTNLYAGSPFWDIQGSSHSTCCWFKSPTLNARTTVYYAGQTLAVYQDSGYVLTFSNDGDGNPWYTNNVYNLIPEDTNGWIFTCGLQITNAGTRELISIVNNKIYTLRLSRSPTTYDSNAYVIGNNLSFNRPYIGNIGFFGYWGKELTMKEIWNIYNSTKGRYLNTTTI